ncbi:MAG: hypothetical protein Q7S90_10750 [Rubrivivax sp.]|nr:hypothetical protein [Rubrivivax sp.]
MADEFSFPGYKLPVNPAWERGTVAQGFVTPSQDRIPQVMSIPPRRVLPIIFLPGTMGTNLRMSAERQAQLKQSNNVAWRPDHLVTTFSMANDSASDRQLRLDPAQTEVDAYDPVGNPTGDPDETSDERNDAVSVGGGLYLWSDTGGGEWPLLMDDRPSNRKGNKTAHQKARERGWGEVYFGSYGKLLLRCEARLNAPYRNGKIAQKWTGIVGVSPSKWDAHPQPLLVALDEETFLAAVKGVWFPVHAMGYNWLQGNRRSGTVVANRITELMKNYESQGFHCEKVILVTHSMGGLVARAVVHPNMGKLNEKVLGIVHGVMPAIGAGAAYKRMRCGVEGDDTAAKVVGNKGTLITAVLGNAQGGLELLPSQAYGNNWLQVRHKGVIIKSLPIKGDPYEEIYKLKDVWFGLLNEKSLNPADVVGGPTFAKTCTLLDSARKFHNDIHDTYHEQSYAHFGADPSRPAWHHVVWTIEGQAKVENVDRLRLVADNDQGTLSLIDFKHSQQAGVAEPRFACTMAPAADPGDQTVPVFSAGHQMRSGKFKGIFRQLGYAHQNSYKDEGALNSTLYSLIRIASTMRWSR